MFLLKFLKDYSVVPSILALIHLLYWHWSMTFFEIFSNNLSWNTWRSVFRNFPAFPAVPAFPTFQNLLWIPNSFKTLQKFILIILPGFLLCIFQEILLGILKKFHLRILQKFLVANSPELASDFLQKFLVESCRSFFLEFSNSFCSNPSVVPYLYPSGIWLFVNIRE